MNMTENLLTTLSEEASEVVLHTSKALRFGLHNGYPNSDTTNAQDIVNELEQLNAVYELLVRRGDLPRLTDEERIVIRRKKKERIKEYQGYSRNLGYLSEE